jgi:hypothetical protein
MKALKLFFLLYHSNELSSINMLHGCKLRSQSLTSEQPPVSVYSVSSVGTDNILLWICEVYYITEMGYN